MAQENPFSPFQNWPDDWTSQERSSWQDIADLSIKTKQAQGKVVFATGVFDLFHQEHQNFLKKAAGVGSTLFVGVESDVRVRHIKGPGRPVQNQAQRLEAVQSFPGVSAAAILPEAFYQSEHYSAIIDLVRPDILAVSSHSPYLEKKQEIMSTFGGTVQVVHQHNPAVSTTQLIEVQ